MIMGTTRRMIIMKRTRNLLIVINRMWITSNGTDFWDYIGRERGSEL